jgi:hypothetical protein
MPEPSNTGLVIRTTSPGWLTSLAHASKSKTAVRLLDDPHIGVDPIKDTLLDMGRKAHLSQTGVDGGACLIGCERGRSIPVGHGDT